MYAFCQDMPGVTVEEQDQLSELLPDEALAGCIAHVSGPIEGGCRIIDVWESEEQYRQFMQQHLYPAIAKLQRDKPVADTRGMAPFTTLEVTGQGRLVPSAA
jgi:hypothetical protein